MLLEGATDTRYSTPQRPLVDNFVQLSRTNSPQVSPIYLRGNPVGFHYDRRKPILLSTLLEASAASTAVAYTVTQRDHDESRETSARKLPRSCEQRGKRPDSDLQVSLR